MIHLQCLGRLCHNLCARSYPVEEDFQTWTQELVYVDGFQLAYHQCRRGFHVPRQRRFATFNRPAYTIAISCGVGEGSRISVRDLCDFGHDLAEAKISDRLVSLHQVMYFSLQHELISDPGSRVIAIERSQQRLRLLLARVAHDEFVVRVCSTTCGKQEQDGGEDYEQAEANLCLSSLRLHSCVVRCRRLHADVW